MKREIGIYIHIPFCMKKCYYCDFISYPDKINLQEQYIESLKKEIENRKEELKNTYISTIYIGGGTPSFIEEKYIKDILDKIKEVDTDNNEKEITIELNPGTVNQEKLRTYKKIGINRLSIGLQSTNNEELKTIGRIHTYKQFLDTYKLARKEEFKNINIDLMLGLPNQKIQDLKQTMQKIIDLKPEHISVYSLIIEEGTIIEKKIRNKELNLPDEELERQMYWYTKNTLEINGYKQYEISNFSKKGFESKHNLNCWKQKEYLGFGVAAHSYLNKTRYSNIYNIEEYIKNIQTKNINKNKIIHEIQSIKDQQKEYMLLGLRTIEGIKIQEFKEKFTQNPIIIFRKELQKLVKENLINIDGDNIKLTNKGLDFANIVWEEFI